MWFMELCGAFAGAVLFHAIVCRIELPLDRVVRFLAVGSVVGLALLGVLSAQYGLMAVETWAALLGYAFACELYIFLFTFTISSISANLLMSLHRRVLTVQEVDRIYDSQRMVAQRLERLLSSGFLEWQGTQLQVTSKGLRFLGVLGALRGFFRHV
jgi:hypothetical protein